MRFFVGKSMWCVLSLTALVLGCAREVVIELPNEKPKMVAICHFVEGDRFRVHITTSQPVYNDDEPVVPDNVDVSISENGAFLDKLFKKTVQGKDFFWESRDTPRVGKTYAMVARLQGYPTIETQGRLPVYQPIEQFALSARDVDTVRLDDGRSELRIPLELRLVNLPGPERYFAFRISHEIGVYDLDYNPPLLDETQTSDSTFFLADGRTLSLLYNTPENLVMVNENFWNEDRRTLSLTARIPLSPDDGSRRLLNLSVEWRTLSKEFYKYYQSLARQGTSLPLSDPDAVFNNINGGYGNFSGYATKTYYIDLSK